MRIFSNFDTKLRQKTFSEYKEKYGDENVICFWRSKYYFIIKVFFPLLFFALITILGLFAFYRRLGGDYFWYIVVALLIMDIVFVVPIIGKYIDYKMDFIIVIPSSIMLYDQWGIFKKDVVTVSSQSVKSISIKKDWLFYSIFNNGDIIILTEGDVAKNGEIRLRWIPRPEKRKNQMIKIIGIDVKANQNPKI